MKILLFTHSQDIDGLGCCFLAKQAFNNVECELCKTFEITDKVKMYIEDKKIYEFDKVFVTDLCIKEPLLSLINRDEILKKKLLVIDHHKSEIDEGNNKYDFVNIVVEKDGKKVSGTSLFYEYLLKNNYLDESLVLNQFVELTRSYDVWDWQNKGDGTARYLHIIFEIQGYKKYLKMINRMVNVDRKIEFMSSEMDVITEFDERLAQDIKNILSKMIVKELLIDNILYKVGYVKCPYCYRNDISEYVKRDNVYNIDLVGMVMTDMETVSYRIVKDVDASKVAVYFDGKGHKAAATNLQSNEKFKKILEEIMMEKKKMTVRVVAALIALDNKYLIAKRSTGKKESLGKWEFPGGKVAYNEDDWQAISREIKEELSIKIKPSKLLGTDIHEYSDRIIELNLYECHYLDGDIVLREHSEYRWVLMKDLLKYDLCAGDKKIAQELINKFNN